MSVLNITHPQLEINDMLRGQYIRLVVTWRLLEFRDIDGNGFNLIYYRYLFILARSLKLEVFDFILACSC